MAATNSAPASRSSRWASRRSPSSSAGAPYPPPSPDARRAHALGHQREVAPERLLRVARQPPRGLLGEQLAQRRQSAAQLVADAHQPLRQGHALGQHLDPRLQQVQTRNAHHLQRGRGHPGRDVRVAVAIAAHPRPERDQRRHRDPLARIALLDRRLELAVELRHHAVQRRGEVDEPAVDLVGGGGGGGADLVGAPQLLDRAGDRAAGLGLVVGHRRALVQIPQPREDARELLDRGPAPRLGRVGGHDEPELGALEHLPQLARRHAPLGEVCHRGAQGAGAGRVAEPALAPAQPPHALVVLGQVHELEPARQRPHQHLGVLERQRADQLLELARGGEIARAPALAQRGGALVQRDGLLALAGGEHGGEQLAQERLVVHERPPAEVAERRGSSLRRHALESRRRAPSCTGPRARM